MLAVPFLQREIVGKSDVNCFEKILAAIVGYNNTNLTNKDILINTPLNEFYQSAIFV